MKRTVGYGSSKHRGVCLVVQAEMRTHLGLFEKVNRSKDFNQLLPYGDDEEVKCNLSTFDWDYVKKKMIWVRNALKACLKSADSDKQQMAWAEACTLGANLHEWEGGKGCTL